MKAVTFHPLTMRKLDPASIFAVYRAQKIMILHQKGFEPIVLVATLQRAEKVVNIIE